MTLEITGGGWEEGGGVGGNERWDLPVLFSSGVAETIAFP